MSDIIQIMNAFLTVVGQCPTCIYKEMNTDPKTHCYMFAEKPIDCRCHKPTDNPFESFVKESVKNEI